MGSSAKFCVLWLIRSKFPLLDNRWLQPTAIKASKSPYGTLVGFIGGCLKSPVIAGLTRNPLQIVNTKLLVINY
jgi:hypothetical protein